MIAAYGTSRMTAIELPRHNAVMPAVRTISAAVRMPDEIVKGRDVLTWYMIFTRSIGAVSSFETPPAAAPDIKSAVALSFGGIGWPETVCRRLRLRGGVRCGPLSGDGGGGSDELEALLLDCDDAMRRARGSSHVRSQLAMFGQVLAQAGESIRPARKHLEDCYTISLCMRHDLYVSHHSLAMHVLYSSAAL